MSKDATQPQKARHNIGFATAKSRRKGWAICACGWAGPERNDPVFAISDGAHHIREVMNERAD